MTDEAVYTKVQRLTRVTFLLYRHPRGLTASELARLCNVTPRTAQRDLKALEGIGTPVCEDDGTPPRYGIIAGYYLPPIHLMLDDALALYLAARLLARYADSFDPHIAAALAKLAAVLPEPIAGHVQATVAAMVGQTEDRRLSEVLGVLALGWATGRVVRIRHQAAGSAEVHVHCFRPYLIEPWGQGCATYAIGYSEEHQALRTFKVERILAAELTGEHYEIPADFDGPALLQSAWGIEYGDELQEVVLRFAKGVTRRVKETCWHPSQALEDCADGGCILRLRVAHPEEMLYWVRGWGPNVEVLAPESMRVQIAREAGEVAGMYANVGNS